MHRREINDTLVCMVAMEHIIVITVYRHTQPARERYSQPHNTLLVGFVYFPCDGNGNKVAAIQSVSQSVDRLGHQVDGRANEPHRPLCLRVSVSRSTVTAHRE
mmetsp:Transcript_7582/g.18528  ORF Transcript_7582/g.18528 Transcript_7582/m.18528 type:complete len:103 (-) Transcript_7582:64-372(-)